MKYNKAKVLLPINIYDNLKEYLRRKKSDFIDYSIVTEDKDHKHKILLNIEKTNSSSYKYNTAKVSISICSKDLGLKGIGKKEFNIDKISQLILIFEVDTNDGNKFLVCVDKDTPNTPEYAKSKLNIMKWNLDNNEYITNIILYSNFADERELMDVCYLLIANRDIYMYNPEIKDFVYNKLDYFGYTKEDKDYDLSIFEGISSTEEMIKEATGRVIYDILRTDEDGNCITGEDEEINEVQKAAYNMYEEYINLLSKECKLD